MPDKHTLSNMTIDEISLVDDPANPEAKAVIVKSKGGFKPCPDCETPDACKAKGGCAKEAEPDGDEGMMKNREAVLEAIEAFAPAIVKHVGDTAGDDAAALAAAILKERTMDLDDVTKALDTATAKITELEGALEKAKADIAKANADRDAAIAKAKDVDKEAPEEDVLKSMPEAIRKRFEDLEKANKAAEDRLEKMREARETEEAIAKAKGYGVGDAAKLGPAMLRIAKGKATAEDVAEIERLLKSAGEILKQAPHFQPRGVAVAADADPEALLKAAAEEIRKAKPELSAATAMDMAMQARPELYAEYRKRRTA